MRDWNSKDLSSQDLLALAEKDIKGGRPEREVLQSLIECGVSEAMAATMIRSARGDKKRRIGPLIGFVSVVAIGVVAALWFSGRSSDREGSASDIVATTETTAGESPTPVIEGNVNSRLLSQTERASLETAVEDYVAALESLDFGKLVDVMPPRLLLLLAEQSDVDIDVYRDRLVEQMGAAVGTATFTGIEVHTEGLAGVDAKTNDGVAVSYTFVPWSFRMQTPNGRWAMEQSMLALREGDAWYLIRVSDRQQQDLLKVLYRGVFDSVEFPASRQTSFD